MNSKAKKIKMSPETTETSNDNVESEESELSVLERLDDHVLLHIFSFLDWNDSISFSYSCTRMKGLEFWSNKQHTEFNMGKYLSDKRVYPKSKLSILNEHLPRIVVLSTTIKQITGDVIEKCKKVKSLKMLQSDGRFHVDGSDPKTNPTHPRISTWIGELQLESLWYSYRWPLSEICGVTNLKELQIGDTRDSHRYIYNLLKANSNVERLSIFIAPGFNFNIFGNLQNLRCLSIEVDIHADMQKLIEHGNLNGLTEFSVCCSGDETQHTLNKFLKSLAEKTNLDKLHLKQLEFINNDTLHALKLFNVSALRMSCDFALVDFTKFILENPDQRLKHLGVRSCFYATVQQIMILLENWKNIETLCFSTHEYVYREFDESFIKQLLKISSQRRMLTLDIHCVRFIKRIKVSKNGFYCTRSTTIYANLNFLFQNSRSASFLNFLK